ncbi:hypothetical protein EDD18DRAFT_1126419 [Armillaria luteobubalina]|uniref:Zn(2)-C6 fungal-type domain-containing protein n=1 Tax=Armillaria luteobubalina TaxID=153913 RepID=A0AA39QN94_9AGAR|nr:hypothetical protein EDD18DRAFT_1126419 [Armillaria luteobubalina]
MSFSAQNYLPAAPTAQSYPRHSPRLTDAQAPTKPRPTQHTRSRTGCLTCRRRRVKCEETKPTCRNCIRDSLNCEFA